MKTDNQTIAEFMGAELVPKVYPEDRQIIKTEEHGNWYLDDLKYDTSWDWLMPVVDKIESLKHKEEDWFVKVLIGPNRCEIIGDLFVPAGWDLAITRINQESKIKAVYEAVINFIKHFNENNK